MIAKTMKRATVISQGTPLGIRYRRKEHKLESVITNPIDLVYAIACQLVMSGHDHRRSLDRGKLQRRKPVCTSWQ